MLAPLEAARAAARIRHAGVAHVAPAQPARAEDLTFDLLRFAASLLTLGMAAILILGT